MKKFAILFLGMIFVSFPIFGYCQTIQISVSATVQSQVPLVSTYPATNIGTNQATLQGNLTTLGSQPQVDVFFQYRKKSETEWQETPRETKTAPANFTQTIVGLSENTTYQFRAGVEWGQPLQQNFGDILEFTTSAAPPPPAGGGGGGGAPPPIVTKVVLQGKAYPSAKITVLVDGKVATIVTADSLANFKAEITDITAGVYNFGLWAEDKEGRRSITFSFTVTVSSGMITTISGIFIPPTIELDKTSVAKGETINIFGQSAPESQISIYVESPEEIVKMTKAKKTGDWDYPLDTNPLEEGMHTTKAKAESLEGLKSAFSSVLAFYVGKYKPEEICPRADFNKDGRTNLIDFSIMLYWWGKYNPCVDQNHDGIVNLPDFSILLYYWTG
jgi:hypothetical protein